MIALLATLSGKSSCSSSFLHLSNCRFGEVQCRGQTRFGKVRASSLCAVPEASNAPNAIGRGEGRQLPSGEAQPEVAARGRDIPRRRRKCFLVSMLTAGTGASRRERSRDVGGCRSARLSGSRRSASGRANRRYYIMSAEISPERPGAHWKIELRPVPRRCHCGTGPWAGRSASPPSGASA